jgi:hypothetical protein
MPSTAGVRAGPTGLWGKSVGHSYQQPGNDLACVVAQLGRPGLRWHQNESAATVAAKGAACIAAAGPPNAFQHAPSPLVEASIKMAEQLGRTVGQVPAGRTDWWDEGFDAGQARSSS